MTGAELVVVVILAAIGCLLWLHHRYPPYAL